MASPKSWLRAMRLRTLPLSLATILTGNFLAIAVNQWSVLVMIFSILTTIFLQVLSNLANDLGDHLKGTDNQNRVGPARSTQSGEISVKEMKTGIYIFIVLSLVTGISLLLFSKMEWKGFFVFLGLGIASIFAAIFYTMGKRPYGYRAMGDVFVFLFFGLLGVGGSFYLNTGIIFNELIFPAASIGFFSAAVLNMNNMRDHINDKANNKNTLVVFLGFEKARIYHSFLILGGCAAILIFILQNYHSPKNLLFLLAFPIYLLNLVKVWKVNDPIDLDPELKKIALGTFLFSILFGLSIIEF
jgi:1,4-dihydroxy-2-naphthoate octaprenyltransferase